MAGAMNARTAQQTQQPGGATHSGMNTMHTVPLPGAASLMGGGAMPNHLPGGMGLPGINSSPIHT